MKEAQERIRILVADDHAMFRQGLRALLESSENFEVVGEASNGAETVTLAHETLPDIILLDVSMPILSGFEVLREISSLSEVRPIMLTAGMAKNDIVYALRLGARGVVWKGSPPHILFKSISCVMDEQLWISRESVSDLVDILRTMTVKPGAHAEVPAAQNPHCAETVCVAMPKASEKVEERVWYSSTSSKKFELTARELEIVGAIVEGQSNRDIAVIYGISEYTVKHHLTRIFDKLGVFSRLELAMFAIHHDLNGVTVTNNGPARRLQARP